MTPQEQLNKIEKYVLKFIDATPIDERVTEEIDDFKWLVDRVKHLEAALEQCNKQ